MCALCTQHLLLLRGPLWITFIAILEVITDFAGESYVDNLSVQGFIWRLKLYSIFLWSNSKVSKAIYICFNG